MSETVPPAEAKRESRTSSLVIAGRLMLLLLASTAAVSAFALSYAGDRSTAAGAGRYACPMHPEVVSAGPSECSICRMALEPVAATPAAASATNPSRSAAPAAVGAAFSLPRSAKQGNTVIGAARRRVIAFEVWAPAWVATDGLVTAVLYEDDLAGLASGDQSWFFRASAPSTGVEVRLTAERPVPWDASTSRIHFRVAPDAPDIALGEVGWVSFTPRPRELLVVPASAILYSPEGPYVLGSDAEGRTFHKRHLELGKIYTKQNLAVVLSGVSEGEKVAVGGAFFLDAERRLQAEREKAAGAAP